jgi:hypothetical protein
MREPGRKLRHVLASCADLEEPLNLLIVRLEVLVVERPPVSSVETLSIREIKGSKARNRTCPLV